MRSSPARSSGSSDSASPPRPMQTCTGLPTRSRTWVTPSPQAASSAAAPGGSSPFSLSTAPTTPPPFSLILWRAGAAHAYGPIYLFLWNQKRLNCVQAVSSSGGLDHEKNSTSHIVARAVPARHFPCGGGERPRRPQRRLCRLHRRRRAPVPDRQGGSHQHQAGKQRSGHGRLPRALSERRRLPGHPGPVRG